ncbi:MAG TPA: ATP-binding protein [Usitatibacteraceae bacterium]|nr:ATP-binding protein [Usitatibacteraceae bacterium]
MNPATDRIGEKTIAIARPRMRLRYPSSFLILLLVGFLIVALPLIAGLIANALAVERVAEQSRQAVLNATIVARDTRLLSAQVLSQERTARFLAASGDPALVEAYAASRDGFRGVLKELADLPVAAGLRDLAASIQAEEQDLFAALSAQPVRADALRALDPRFAALNRLVEDFNRQAGESIDREVQRLADTGARSRSRMWWQLLAMVPAALLMIAGFTYLLARPISDLDAAIHRLGEGKLAQRIRVPGPHDIEMLGVQLDWLRQRLISLEDQKTRFFQHVSHELKTPLAALREGSSLLSEEVVGSLNEEQREVARILRQNSVTLERLIQDLLTYSQIQSAERLDRKTAFDPQPIELKDLVDHVVDAQQIAMVAKAITLRRECERTPFHGDVDKLRVIVDNLLSNAIKYSPPGGTITLRLGKYKGNAVLEVIDCGPGIAEEDRTRVFDPFFRGKNATHFGAKGTGLGLAIVRDYVNLHQGTVQALPASGAHFRVILPVIDPHQDPRSGQPS